MDDKQSYYKKYLKYKKKYLKLKNEKQLQREIHHNKNSKSWMSIPFYFIHGTSFENLLMILDDEYLKPGKSVPQKCIRLGGYPLDCIFSRIYFEEVKNISTYFGNSLILSPEILNDHNVGFNEGWSAGPDKKTLMLNKNDTNDILVDKLVKIKNFLQKKSVNESGDPEVMDQEVLFFDQISLKKYLLGIVCYECDKTNLDKIKKASKKYGDIFITTNPNEFPKLADLI